jgi:DNA-binding transcriptional regulator YdaS (Cro superfamily)
MGLFDRKKTNEDDNNLENNSLEKKVDEALLKARNEKRDTQKEIENIKSWAAEAIIDTYGSLFPNGHLTFYREQYKKDAIAKYDKIKTENADKVSPEAAEKCDKIVKAYLNQIALRESKLKLFEKVEAEYLLTKEKLKGVAAQKAKGDKFLKHSERLNSLDNHAETLSEAMLEQNKMNDIKQEFELKAEYVNQLEKLKQNYSDDVNHDNASAFKDEIDKMLQDMG